MCFNKAAVVFLMLYISQQALNKRLKKKMSLMNLKILSILSMIWLGFDDITNRVDDCLA